MPKEKVIVVIPARYGSTRFPGKVLAKDTGKFLIQHVYEQACSAKLPDKVIIAADDRRIADAAKSFDAECVMTSPDCPSGTDRIAQAIQKLNAERCPPALSVVEGLNADDIVVNLQADEPEIDPDNIDTVANLLLTQHSTLKTKNFVMATLVAEFENESQIADPNIVKVIISQSAISNQQSAIYFSRSVIPYDRRQGGIGPKSNYLRHLGIYAYRKDFLLKITKLPQTPLEKIEKLEQLRAIENGFDILVAKVKPPLLRFAKQSGGGAGIDTPEQYAEFVKRYKQKI